jgi:hypothetical protein
VLWINIADEAITTDLAQNWTDANWGPQDASHPKEGVVQYITKEEVRSLLGHCITRMSGPIAWGCVRERKSSRSSCKSEIKSMDEGCKSLKNIHHMMTNLKLPNVATRPNSLPLFNDNQGAIKWSHGCNISKKLRHLNIREIAVRDGQALKLVDIRHVPGHSNIADFFTKEFKPDDTFCKLSFQLLSVRDSGACYVESGIHLTDALEPGAAAA